MRLLLDTHIWIWEVLGDERLERSARRAIARARDRGELYISPINAWEFALLVGRGRIRPETSVSRWIEEALDMPGTNLAALTPAIAVASCELPMPLPGDPTDRFLIATAREIDARLVTVDERILAYGRAGHVAVFA